MMIFVASVVVVVVVLLEKLDHKHSVLYSSDSEGTNCRDTNVLVNQTSTFSFFSTSRLFSFFSSWKTTKHALEAVTYSNRNFTTEFVILAFLLSYVYCMTIVGLAGTPLESLKS